MAGRLLTYADISQGLVGKRGELFWPDDNLWYLVEIHSVSAGPGGAAQPSAVQRSSPPM